MIRIGVQGHGIATGPFLADLLRFDGTHVAVLIEHVKGVLGDLDDNPDVMRATTHTQVNQRAGEVGVGGTETYSSWTKSRKSYMSFVTVPALTSVASRRSRANTLIYARQTTASSRGRMAWRSYLFHRDVGKERDDRAVHLHDQPRFALMPTTDDLAMLARLKELAEMRQGKGQILLHTQRGMNVTSTPDGTPYRKGTFRGAKGGRRGIDVDHDTH